MDLVDVCKPAWWGTSSRIPDTAGYMVRKQVSEFITNTKASMGLRLIAVPHSARQLWDKVKTWALAPQPNMSE